MALVTLLTGSNDADARRVLQRTAEALVRRIGEQVAASQLYESEPWGFTAERGFVNQALQFNTALEPIEVLDAALGVEQEIGRRRDEELAEKMATGERYASRVVDVDVMFYDDEIIDTPRLKVPHPLLHLREFALEPLCEIMGHYRHPVLGRSLSELWAELRIKSE